MADLLLLDNDERIVELLSWFLGERGFSIRVAHSFAEARERLAEARPDLLISDVDLGTESAVDQLPLLSSEGILPPTLVVSGYLDTTVRAAIMAVPEVLDTLPKPFEFPLLEEKVRSCLSRRDEVQREKSEVPAPPVSPGVEVTPSVEPLAQPEVEAGPVDTDQGEDQTSVDDGDDDDDDDGWIEITGS